MTLWTLTHRRSPLVAAFADRHYSRQSIGSDQFAPPGRLIALVALDGLSAWTSVSQAFCMRRSLRSAWVNSLFRREGGELASDLIRSACAETLALWGRPPEDGLVTLIDPHSVRPKRDPGRCYLRAGFRRVGVTGSGLIMLRLAPEDFPRPELPIGATGVLHLPGAA